MMDVRPDASTRSPLLTRSLAAVSLLAIAVAGYLAWMAWSQRGLPLGCGEQGGCAEVLTSRWSTLWGIPVGAVALPLYIAVFGAVLLRTSESTRSRLLSFAAAALVAAAVWFVGLQVFVLRAYCLWCLVEHALGLTLAALAAATLWRAGPAVTPRGVWPAALLGLSSVILLAAVQTLQPAGRSVVRVPQGAAVSLLEGQLQLTGDDPRLGAADAPHNLYLFFDYCCPHCRRTHAYLLEALQQYPDQLSVICLPAPRDADCNPAIGETEARFQHACELAELALAVWWANPDAFAEFDRWLFSATQPRAPDEARRKASELAAAESLEAQLTRDAVRQRIARNVKAFNESRWEYLPVIMAPGMDTIVGRLESREALMKILTDELLAGRTTASPDGSAR